MSERVKLADAGLITSLSDTDNMLLESGGSMRRAALSTFTDKVMGDMDANLICDDVQIAARASSSGALTAYKLDVWPAQQAGGGYAIGVLLQLPGHPIIVAPTGATDLPWASERKLCGEGKALKDAFADMDGQANTATALAACDGDFECGTADYAPGFCNLYSRLDADGNGVGAGSWWLPSFGELQAISANYYRINYALSLIDGATALSEVWTWSSTERSSDGNAFIVFLKRAQPQANLKTSSVAVRPVTGMWV